MNTKTLGLIGMICGPFLAILTNVYGIFENYKPTSLGGVFSLIYMTGWFCSIIGLYKLNAAGTGRTGRAILIIQMIFLTLGEIWNVYSIIQPGSSAFVYWALDMFWPISNIFMLVTGLTILLARQLQGWRRFFPLIAGLWFPVTVILAPMFFGTGSITVLITGLYSTIAWVLLGFAVYSSKYKASKAINTLPGFAF